MNIVSGELRPNALIVISDEVRGNHAYNLGRVLGYGGEIAVVSYGDIAEAVFMAGMPSPDATSAVGDFEALERKSAYYATLGKEIGGWLTEDHNVDPSTTDIHYLRPPTPYGLEGDLGRHWGHAVISIARSYDHDRSMPWLWHYTPFQPNVGAGAQLVAIEHGGEIPPSEINNPRLQKRRLPQDVKFATATLDSAAKTPGEIRKVCVDFGYPTTAEITRKRAPGGANKYGEKVLYGEETSVRTYEPPVPSEMQEHIDRITTDCALRTSGAHEADQISHIASGADYWNTMEGRLLAPYYNEL